MLSVVVLSFLHCLLEFYLSDVWKKMDTKGQQTTWHPPRLYVRKRVRAGSGNGCHSGAVCLPDYRSMMYVVNLPNSGSSIEHKWLSRWMFWKRRWSPRLSLLFSFPLWSSLLMFNLQASGNKELLMKQRTRTRDSQMMLLKKPTQVEIINRTMGAKRFL